MKLRQFAFWTALAFGMLAFTSAHAEGAPKYNPGKEHCETKCTLDHETCQSDTSDSIDECESNCDEKVCSKCQETMDAATLEACSQNCRQCENTCDSNAEPHREACDNRERRCLGKCMDMD